MKKLLIITPYFPPVNAADMQRVRLSVPYFEANGWVPEIVTVNEKYTDLATDDLLLQSIPAGLTIHKVKAFSKRFTSKFGLGSIALRSLWFYKRKVNRLLATGKFDLIYFSTTQFPVCVLGAYWKKRFGVPYVIDMQDPWHSDYYKDKPKEQRPAKYWFSYHLNKFLEPIAMKHVDGLVSVSAAYIKDLKERYPELAAIPSATITFGAAAIDNKIARHNRGLFEPLLPAGFKNTVYIGRGGMDMHKAIAPLFLALKKGLAERPELFKILRVYFIGTSYAPPGEGKATILSLARKYGVDNNIIEITDRIGYYHTLSTLQQANALFIPCSDDPKYSASKIYPYLLINKPLLAIFDADSPVNEILAEYGVKHAYALDDSKITDKIYTFLIQVAAGNLEDNHYHPEATIKYAAETLTGAQCRLFNEAIDSKN